MGPPRNGTPGPHSPGRMGTRVPNNRENGLWIYVQRCTTTRSILHRIYASRNQRISARSCMRIHYTYVSRIRYDLASATRIYIYIYIYIYYIYIYIRARTRVRVSLVPGPIAGPGTRLRTRIYTLPCGDVTALFVF